MFLSFSRAEGPPPAASHQVTTAGARLCHGLRGRSAKRQSMYCVPGTGSHHDVRIMDVTKLAQPYSVADSYDNNVSNTQNTYELMTLRIASIKIACTNTLYCWLLCSVE